jgi:hypothetical protein
MTEPRPSLGGRRGLAGRTWLALLIVAVAIAATYDVVTVGRGHHQVALVGSTRQQLHTAMASLAATTSKDAATTSARTARVAADTQTRREEAAVTTTLGAADRSLALQRLDLVTLHTCLSGVSVALASIAGGNLPGAVESITDSSSSCLSLDGSSSSSGLAYPFDFPDPYVLTVGSEYYAFATNSAAGNIQIIQSSDLTHWTTVGDALPHLARWAQPGATWGPSVLQRGNTYVLYYSAVFGGTGDQCISEAVATQPQGPYVDSSTWPLVCQVNLGGSIDPSPFVAPDGTAYLTWKSQGENGQPATLWSQALNQAGTGLAAGTSPSSLLQPSQAWQGGIVEGPDMVTSGGRYYLLYSANNWKAADYAIGVADCSGPNGPCTPATGQPLVASQTAFSGPGGPTVFADTQGTLWLAFHAWLPGKVGYPNSRPLFLWRVSFTDGTVQVSP